MLFSEYELLLRQKIFVIIFVVEQNLIYLVSFELAFINRLSLKY